jgi:hypothetical protein
MNVSDFLAHECAISFRPLTLAFAAVKTVRSGGRSTGRDTGPHVGAFCADLVDRSLAEVRNDGGNAVLNSPFFLSEFMA